MGLTTLQNCSSIRFWMMMARLSNHLSFRQFKVFKEDMIFIFLTQLNIRVQKIVQCQLQVPKSLLLPVKSGMVDLGSQYTDGSIEWWLIGNCASILQWFYHVWQRLFIHVKYRNGFSRPVRVYIILKPIMLKFMPFSPRKGLMISRFIFILILLLILGSQLSGSKDHHKR